MGMTRLPPRKPNWKIQKGFCVWCADKVEGRRRSWCSQACVDEYRVANFAGDAAEHVWKRDKGVCAGCGFDTTSVISWRQCYRRFWGYGEQHPEGPVTPVEWHRQMWHADHVIPLWSVDRTAPDAFSYWTLANLQTLCAPCHKAKTKAEAAERAGRRHGPNAQSDLFAEAV
jgi:5-methylcytosine-specific restriction protein A